MLTIENTYDVRTIEKTPDVRTIEKTLDVPPSDVPHSDMYSVVNTTSISDSVHTSSGKVHNSSDDKPLSLMGTRTKKPIAQKKIVGRPMKLQIEEK